MRLPEFQKYSVEIQCRDRSDVFDAAMQPGAHGLGASDAAGVGQIVPT
jgi:hypothetical protein